MLSYISPSSLLTVTHTGTGSPSDYPLHSHRLWELYCFLSGEACQYVGGQPFSLTAPSLLLIQAGRQHQLHVDTSKPYERLVIHFSTGLFPGTPPAILDEPIWGEQEMARYLPLKPERDELSMLLISRMCDPSFYSASPDDNLIACLRLLLNELQTAPASPAPTGIEGPSPHPDSSSEEDTDLVGRLLSYIDLHATELSGLEMLESEFFFSRSYLNRVFRQTTGDTLWNYVIRKRLQMADAMLQEGKRASVAAGACGFRDYYSFYRQYQRFFGRSPGQAISSSPGKSNSAASIPKKT